MVASSGQAQCWSIRPADATIDQLFGITSATASNKRALKPAEGQVVVTDDGAGWGLDAKELSGLVSAEPYIKAAGGTPLVRIGATDAIITRRLGKGWTVYLNTLFDKYPKLRAQKFGGANYRALVNTLLDRAGARPTIQVLSADGKRLT